MRHAVEGDARTMDGFERDDERRAEGADTTNASDASTPLARAEVRDAVERARAAYVRCERCGFQRRACACAELQPIAVSTRVVVLRHRKEVYKTSNTGRLVPLVLEGGELRRVGGPGVKIDPRTLVDPDRRQLLLFPAHDSVPLAADPHDPRPVTLYVPDTTWTLAKRLVKREPALASLPRVHVPPGPPSAYRLRHHLDPNFLATFEAVARALGVLEGAAVQHELEHVFARFVERTLASRRA